MLIDAGAVAEDGHGCCGKNAVVAHAPDGAVSPENLRCLPHDTGEKSVEDAPPEPLPLTEKGFTQAGEQGSAATPVGPPVVVAPAAAIDSSTAAAVVPVHAACTIHEIDPRCPASHWSAWRPSQNICLEGSNEQDRWASFTRNR